MRFQHALKTEIQDKIPETVHKNFLFFSMNSQALSSFETSYWWFPRQNQKSRKNSRNNKQFCLHPSTGSELIQEVIVSIPSEVPYLSNQQWGIISLTPSVYLRDIPKPCSGPYILSTILGDKNLGRIPQH